jgi:ribonuclease BN (tRNA processing enzyme)
MGAPREADSSGDPGRSARAPIVTEITFIGTSDAFGAGGRRQSAIFLRGSSGNVLLDCGATTGSGLHELGISVDEIDAILVSHFHGDHFGGIPLLLLAALYEENRKRALRIAGPPGVGTRVRELAAAMGHNLDGREFSFPLEFVDLPAGVRSEIGPLRVRTFATHHNPDAMPHGMLIDAGDAKIAYSGDTGWFDGLPRQVAGSDLFICECTYHRNGFDYHLSHQQLVENREKFDCGRMILTHLGAEMADRRATSEFEAADDGLTIRI